MLAIFRKSVGKAPAELSVPAANRQNCRSSSTVAEIFTSERSDSTVYRLPEGNIMAVSHQNEHPLMPRSVAVTDDVYCLFVGSVENISELRHYYGLSRNTNESLLVVEVYKVLRDRAPYPADQVIRDFVGNFAFVLFDLRNSTLFAARDRDGRAKLHWGIANDETLVFADDVDLVTDSCGASSGPFPQGCIFMNGSGSCLASFVHPLNKMKAVMQDDDAGKVSSVIFKVDLYARLPSIPRVGSNANWADATMVD